MKIHSSAHKLIWSIFAARSVFCHAHGPVLKQKFISYFSTLFVLLIWKYCKITQLSV